MSDIEVLRNAIITLDRVEVPIAYMEQIALPIANANLQLKKLYNFILDQNKKKEAEKSETSDSDIEIGDVQIIPEGETPKEE